ncbi:MAG TPA: hypothetical protein VM513_00030, partial [Kofleriaceae bacterium]|nr:hypothetical protein [Kofleriaceae bacterium]
MGWPARLAPGVAVGSTGDDDVVVCDSGCGGTVSSGGASAGSGGAQLGSGAGGFGARDERKGEGGRRRATDEGVSEVDADRFDANDGILGAEHEVVERLEQQIRERV